MRVSILASGSSGNITLLETGRTRLLVDAGLGKRETLARLAAVERTVEHIDGILITHEHTDHCNGLPQMLGIWKPPLYVTEPTMDAMKRILPETFGKRLRRVETIQPGQHFTVKLQQVLVVVEEQEFVAGGHIWCHMNFRDKYKPFTVGIASQLKIYRRVGLCVRQSAKGIECLVD